MVGKVAVVTGANKGIGLETARQLASQGIKVVLTARNQQRGIEARDSLHQMGLQNVVFHQLDVLDPISVQSLPTFIDHSFGSLDILQLSGKAVDMIKERIRSEERRNELDNIETLTVEKLDGIVERFLKDFKENRLEEGRWSLMLPAYSISKASLNAYTRILAKRFPKMLINCVHPGSVDTDLNWHTGPMPVEEGARGPVKCALLPDGGPTSCYFDQTQVTPF